MVDFTVVGGGMAGLVVARRLAMAGRAVTLLEASGRLGGTVSRRTVDGLDLDVGAESFATRGGTVAVLATELGLGNEIVAPSTAGAWLQTADGRAVPLPATSLLGIPGTPLAADVIEVIGRAGAFRAQLDALIPSLRSHRADTLGSLVRSRMGRAVLDGLVAPVVHGVHSVHPDELPLNRAAPGLAAALAKEGSLASAVRSLRAAAPAGSAVEGIRGGVNRLVTELVADLDTYHVDVQLGRRAEPGERLDGVVVMAASPTTDARRVVIATLVVDAPELDAAPRGSGLLVARGAPGIGARALTHSTAKWGWLRERAGGRHVLRLSYDEEPETLERAARLDASALLGVELGAPAVLGFGRDEWLRAAASRAGVADDDAPVQVGEAVAGSGLAGVIRHAEEMAVRLLAQGETGASP